jgi:ADA HAT complex component 1
VNHLQNRDILHAGLWSVNLVVALGLGMHMFRFWANDSRGSDKTVGDHSLMIGDYTKPLPPTTREIASHSEDANIGRPPKRRRPSTTDEPAVDAEGPLKRAKPDHDDARAQVGSPASLDRARDVIQHHFSLEILLKHNELRLIDQELAKCQIALEQLRRCHLVPYPTSCPTPDQMLDIANGKGPALHTNPGEALPMWAPPFGVVEGPYARHLAKWLIPDPVFDGVQAAWQPFPTHTQNRTYTDGRSTRNTVSDGTGFGKRLVRGAIGQKLQALSAGYPQPKDKNGPCTLKRGDGQMVKLVCNDCHRENFSSTQGFINHCRIAHRKEFKSHEEAAVACGHPIDIDDTRQATATDDPSSTSGLVHALARSEPITQQQAYSNLLTRIDSSLKLWHDGRHPTAAAIPGASRAAKIQMQKETAGLSETPFLARLLQLRGHDGDLMDAVADATTREDDEDDFEDEGDEQVETPRQAIVESPVPLPDLSAMRTPSTMRMPARTTAVPLPIIPNARPVSRKSQAPSALATNSVVLPASSSGLKEESSFAYDEEDLDADLSPNTLASNNAPSLVSDDGEYDDDTDDGSTAGNTSEEEEEATSVSDVAEITLDDDVQHEAPRDLRHHKTTPSLGVKLKKAEAKHVTFIAPVASNTGTGRGRGRRKQTSTA